MLFVDSLEPSLLDNRFPQESFSSRIVQRLSLSDSSQRNGGIMMGVTQPFPCVLISSSL